VASSTSSARTFEGQGNELFEQIPRGSVHLPVAAPTSPVNRNVIVPRRPLLGAVPYNFLPNPPFAGFGTGFRGRLGLGFGFTGFGWNPCGGFAWTADPLCFNSYSFAPDYGYGYPPDDFSTYPAPPDAGYNPTDQPSDEPETAAPSASSQPNGLANPNWDTSGNAPSVSALGSAAAVIYFKDGTSVQPSDYWFNAEKLHYVLGGEENVIDIELLDLPRTNAENRKNGVKFWLKSGPDAAPATNR
jgi:hypothetical protein